jgi:hypothetical protein
MNRTFFRMQRSSRALLVLMLIVVAASGGNKNVGERRVDRDTDVVIKNRTSQSGPVVMNPVQTDSLTHVVGTTFADYVFNSGGPCHVVYWQGKTYMLYVGKASATVAREITYTCFYGTTWLPVQAVLSGAVQSTSTAGIDVWRGGVANGFAGVAAGRAGSGSTSYYGLESWPGQGGFTNTAVTPYSVVQCLNLDSLGTVIYEDSKGGTDYELWKSTDFGTTWATLSAGLIAAVKASGGLDSVIIQGSLEPNIVRAANGDIYVGTTLWGNGAIPPIDTVANPGRADQWGYFKSTNRGVNWTYARIAPDGFQYAPNHYALFENFAQHDMVVDNANRVHAVTNGYNLFQYAISTDSVRGSIDVVYWDATNGFKSLVSFNTADPYLPTVIAKRGPSGGVGGNGLGCSYPTIACSPDGQVIVCIWSQPNWTGTTCDTLADGYVTKSLWYIGSTNGGATWLGARRITPRFPGRKDEFGIMADNIQMVGGLARVRILYLSIGTGSIGLGDDAEPMIFKEFDALIVDVKQTGEVVESYSLSQNYPNPFNPTTQITYSIPARSEVKLSVFNVLGQEVATLVNDTREKGTYTAEFGAANFSSGVYFSVLRAGAFRTTRKMMLMK